MKQRYFSALAAAAIAIALIPAAAQGEEEFVLENGLRVVLIQDGGKEFFSAVLVCPLPADIDEDGRAAAKLVNRLIWSGGAELGSNLRQYEYRMIALRFGGSIGSQLTADALLIHYTLPSAHLESALGFMAKQWGALEFGRERLDSARRRLASEQQAASTSSVLTQLMREVEQRIWSDLPYRFREFGSDSAIAAAGEEQVRAMHERLREPGNLVLLVDGDIDVSHLRAVAEETLGSLEGTGSGSTQAAAGEPPQLGVRLQLPADLTQKHAIVAFRLPEAAAMDTQAAALLARYLERSPGARSLREDLGAGGTFSVGLNIWKRAGMLYLYAAWDGDAYDGDVARRMSDLAVAAGAMEPEAASFETARKTLLLNYWNRRQAVQSYALWRAGLVSIGVGEDRFATSVEQLDAEGLRVFASKVLTADGRLILVTIPR